MGYSGRGGGVVRLLLGAVLSALGIVAVILLFALLPWLGAALAILVGLLVLAYGRWRARRGTGWYAFGGVIVATGAIAFAATVGGAPQSPTVHAGAPASRVAHPRACFASPNNAAAVLKSDMRDTHWPARPTAAFCVAISALEQPFYVEHYQNFNNQGWPLVREVETWPQVSGGKGVQVFFTPNFPLSKGAVIKQMAAIDAAFYRSPLRAQLKWVQAIAYWPPFANGASVGYVYKTQLSASQASGVDWNDPHGAPSRWDVVLYDASAFQSP